ncbi:enolase-phosphatase E1-like, partial [Nylanderia fulva]|uniref:enolase-phosphatase E1-like n=1 Tax=Nylanderia fulva TaxID=613905 RepID=UPI0010FAF2A3
MKHVNENIKLSNKICYKCAYELGQCAKFVQKYKKSHDASKPEAETSMPCCCLCFEHIENNRIFDITKDNRAIFNPLQKIRKIFNEDLKKNDNSKLICLTCRYNLDVLYDLRKVYQEVIINLKALINNKIDYSNFPKIYTDVVNRKTTVTIFPDIIFYDLINSDSKNSENMKCNKTRAKNRTERSNAQTKSRNNVKLKVRKCDKCHNIVPNGTDMYRFNRSRLTVCRNCWITMDPSKDKLKLRSREVEPNLTETKLCAVFLIDVLDKKSEKEFKIEKNQDNKSNDNSEDRLSGSFLNIMPKSEDAVNDNRKQGKKRQINAEKNEDVESTPTKVTKLSKKPANATEAKTSSDMEQPLESTTCSTRQRRKRAAAISSDFDTSPSSLKEKSKSQTESLSPSSSKPDRKKLKTIVEGISTNVHSESTNESSPKDTNSKRMTRKASTARASKEKNVRKRTRSSSISSIETVSLAERLKSPKSVSSPEDKKKCHTCDMCGKKFDTKLESAEHRPTHLLQTLLKLERLTISNIKLKQELKLDSEEDKISEEAKKTVIEKCRDEINIEDTDEEMSSVTRKEDVEKKETNSESCNVTDKLDTENELCVDESAKYQSDEKMMEESEQCVESSVSNGTVTSVEIEQNTGETKNTEEKNTKNKNRKASTDRDIDTLNSKDTDIQNDIVAKETSSSTSKCSHSLFNNFDEEENKNVSAEDGTKVTTEEKGKSNNDEDHVHEETAHDNETTKSSVSSIINMTKDTIHSKSCKNDLKNSCKDNESEVVKDIEGEQCDSVNKSRKKNINKSKEKKKNMLNIVEETETLKDQIDLDDVVVDENKVIDENRLAEDGTKVTKDGKKES